MAADPFVYEEHFSLRGRTARNLIIALVFVLAGLFVPMPLGLRLFDLVFFGGCGLLMLYIGGSHQVALRVDEQGVTLGGTPPRTRSGTRVVPWADIERVALWRQPMPYGRSMTYVGLRRRPGAPPLAGRGGQLAGRAVASTLTPGISADTLMASRAVNGWSLEPERLAAAVDHFAPGIRTYRAW